MNLFMYISVCIMHTSLGECMHAWMHVSIHGWIYMYMYVMYVYMHACLDVHVCTTWMNESIHG